MQQPPAEQANVEYWFRQLYDLYARLLQTDSSTLAAKLSHWWIWITAVGYALSVFAIFIIVYTTMRLYELRKREHEEMNTLIVPPHKAVENPRWKHIQSLMEGGSPSDWRQAIIEADIMLDDLLLRQGYEGEGVSEKLKRVDRSDLATLNDAWEAHKVRNRIAHDGSAFDLSAVLAQRTVAQFEAVFRELRAI